MKISQDSKNVMLLTFFVLLGLSTIHFLPTEGREISHDAFIALLALLKSRPLSTPQGQPSATTVEVHQEVS